MAERKIHVSADPDALARGFLAETKAYWHTWVRDLNIPFDWQQAVIRAAVTLRWLIGLSFLAPKRARAAQRAGPRTRRVSRCPGRASG